MKYAIALLLLFLLFLIYVYAESRLLVTRRYEICSMKLPMSFDGMKIVQISDIHSKTYKNGWQQLVRRIKELEPDFILITGDLISRKMTDYRKTEVLLRKLKGIAPVICSLGNHELDLSDRNRSRLMGIIESCGCTVLNNNTAEITEDGESITIAGLSLEKANYKNENGGYKDLKDVQPEDIRRDIGSKKGFTILMAHNPLFLESYAEWGAEIIFSGHVHGGVGRLPLIGGILSPERKFFPKYTKGLYAKDGSTMLVSTGIGKLRVFNPSEIVFCQLFRK